MSDSVPTQSPEALEGDTEVVVVEFHSPFFQILEREAARTECSVEELLRRWAWVQHGRVMDRRYGDLKPTVDVDVPQELWERAGLIAALRDGDHEQRRDEWLFNHVSLTFDWQPRGSESEP